jgi:glyoxylate reductase
MTDQHRVFVTRRLPGDALDRLAQHAEVDLWPGDLPPPYDELHRRTAAADALICLLTDRIDAALIDAAPRLRVISAVAVGYDNIDLAAATARAIPIGNTPGVLTETTADLAFALMLAVARRITEADRFVRDGKWQTWDPDLLLGYDVYGATLGIIGYGKIGQAVARRAAGFAMRVLYASRKTTPSAGAALAPPGPAPELTRAGRARPPRTNGPSPVDLDTLLRESDFVSLHVPLTADTYHLIAEPQLRAMKRTAILVNTARGAVIDQPALVRALEEGWIAGAGLDVAEVEPAPPDDPILRAPNAVLLPHIGSASHATRGRMASIAVDNCIAGLRGDRLPYCVNPEVYER